MQLHPEICHESTKKGFGINSIPLNAVPNDKHSDDNNAEV